RRVPVLDGGVLVPALVEEGPGLLLEGGRLLLGPRRESEGEEKSDRQGPKNLHGGHSKLMATTTRSSGTLTLRGADSCAPRLAWISWKPVRTFFLSPGSAVPTALPSMNTVAPAGLTATSTRPNGSKS